MNLLPSFSAVPFLLAGIVAALGPVIIHLLNRRRYRTVQWAAMNFLREAIRRNRRILQIRDLVLLTLRTLVVLLFGLALAQPYFSHGLEEFDGTRPLHAVLLIDNSASMGYESLEGSLLDRAKQRARQFVDQLPADSRVSVIPLCGSPSGYSPDAYTKKNAGEALDAVTVVDRSASVQQALNEARKACDAGPQLARRILLLSDQQAINWKDLSGKDIFEDLPPIQFVNVAPTEWHNAWVSDFRVQDGVADIETPTTFLVQIRSRGSLSQRDAQVTLSVDGLEVASKTISLEPGLGAQEVAFDFLFDAYHPEPGQVISVPVAVKITGDRLARDDQRFLVVPVVAALPVVFVDQYGRGEENAQQRRLGETRHLRKLLAPVANRSDSAHQLVEIRHLKIDDLSEETLSDARLVVIAGIADPANQVSLLREYVEQGGQLVIAAGGDFDPSVGGGFDPRRWSELAWLDGEGILPTPLIAEPLGVTPNEATGQLTPFFLDYDSLSFHRHFQLAGVGEAELRELYAEPFFFKAIQSEWSEAVLESLAASERKRLEARYGRARPSAGESSTADSAPSDGPRRWLAWNSPTMEESLDQLPDDPEARAQRIDELAQGVSPRILARFDDPNRTPYLIERSIGQGTVLFVSSGLLSDWNTLPKTNTILIFDRILRSMMQSTLPARNLVAKERIVLPLPTSDRDLSIQLLRPENGTEFLDPGFVSRDRLGVTVRSMLTRGLYTIKAERSDNGTEPVWQIPLAVNGDPIESELTPLTGEEFAQRVTSSNARWVAADESISLAGTQLRGQNSWWWLILSVLVLLGAELAVLVLPVWNRSSGKV